MYLLAANLNSNEQKQTTMKSTHGVGQVTMDPGMAEQFLSITWAAANINASCFASIQVTDEGIALVMFLVVEYNQEANPADGSMASNTGNNEEEPMDIDMQ